jgi:hypothetical protein
LGEPWGPPGNCPSTPVRFAPMLSLRTISARRYRVHGRLPSPHGADFLRRLGDRRFLPLTAREERTYGWVTADNLLVTEFHVDNVVRGEYAVLGVRIDKRRVNARLLRAQLELEVLARKKAASDAGRPFRLPREERAQLRADLHGELLRETPPTVEAHTVVLHTKRRALWVLHLARGANEIVVRLVRDTFGVELAPLTPWRRGEEILAGSPAADTLDDLRRTEFGAPSRFAPPSRPHIEPHIERGVPR